MKACATLAIIAALVSSAVVATLEIPAQTAGMHTYSATIRSINIKTRTLTAGEAAEILMFSVPTDAEIVVKDKPKADLGDLMVGDKLEIKYTEGDGTNVAHWIAVLGVKD